LSLMQSCRHHDVAKYGARTSEVPPQDTGFLSFRSTAGIKVRTWIPSSPCPSAAAGRKDPRRFCFRPGKPACRRPPGSRATSLLPCRKPACGAAHPAPFLQDECGKCASSFAAPSTATRPGKVEGEARVSSSRVRRPAAAGRTPEKDGRFIGGVRLRREPRGDRP
jgi:hypothetical protein